MKTPISSLGLTALIHFLKLEWIIIYVRHFLKISVERLLINYQLYHIIAGSTLLTIVVCSHENNYSLLCIIHWLRCSFYEGHYTQFRMVRFYPVYYHQQRGKKGHCPVFTQVVSRVYPNYWGKKGTLKNEYN